MDMELTKIKKIKSGMFSGGWPYDTHKYLEPLDAGKTIELANIKGPAVVKYILVTKNEIIGFSGERKKAAPRGIVILVYYNDQKKPAVEVPLADFFCDGCNGRADYFSNIFIEYIKQNMDVFGKGVWVRDDKWKKAQAWS